MSSVSDRSEIAQEYKWDLESLFVDDSEWENAFEATKEEISTIESFEGQATEDAETVRILLETYEDLMRSVSDIMAYARMRRDEDTRESDTQAMMTQAQSLLSQARSAASFIEPELQELSEREVAEMIEAEPDLEIYDHYFDNILRQKPHTRSTEVENLLAELGEVTGASGEIYNMLANADMEFPVVEDPDGDIQEITLANFTTLQKHPEREFRQTIYEEFYDEWETVRNAVGTAYRNSVKTDEKLATARNYDSAQEASMHGPNVPVEVYDTLVETVRDNLDKLHRHAELKRERTAGDSLRMWDLYVPLVESESPEVTYDEAREYVTDAVAPLGEEYQSRLAEGLDSRWVDVYETLGKQSGAYSSGTYDSQPYILLNYQDDVSSMFTLAHELGHSMHSELASESQPYVYADYTIFIAEIASTVNETLLTHHLLDTVEDEQLRRHVLNQYLERFRSTLYRQTMFAEFEQRAHELSAAGEALTTDHLDELYEELKSAYYEPGVVDDRIASEWMRIPHFYRSFYVYQYATGISAAVALVEAIQNDDEAATRYLDFLRSGSHGYPLELLEDAGVDMTASTPIERALTVYDDYLGEFEQLQ